MPVISDAIVDAIRNGAANITISGNERNTTTITTHTYTDSKHTETVVSEKSWKRAAELVANGFRRIQGTFRPVDNVTDLPADSSQPFFHRWGNSTKQPRSLNTIIENVSKLMPERKSLVVGGKVDVEKTKARLAQFLVIVAFIFWLVLLWFLYGKAQKFLQKRKRNRDVSLESQHRENRDLAVSGNKLVWTMDKMFARGGRNRW